MKILLIGTGLVGSRLLKSIGKKQSFSALCTVRNLEKRDYEKYLKLSNPKKISINNSLIFYYQTGTQSYCFTEYNVFSNTLEKLLNINRELFKNSCFDCYIDAFNRETVLSTEQPSKRNINRLSYLLNNIKILKNQNKNIKIIIASTTGTGGINPKKMTLHHNWASEGNLRIINKTAWAHEVEKFFKDITKTNDVYLVIPSGVIMPASRIGNPPAYGILNEKLGPFLKTVNEEGKLIDKHTTTRYFILGESGPHTTNDLYFVDGMFGTIYTKDFEELDFSKKSRKFILKPKLCSIYKSRSYRPSTKDVFITLSPVGPETYMRDIILWWLILHNTTKKTLLDKSNNKVFNEIINSIKTNTIRVALRIHAILGVSYNIPSASFKLKSPIERITLSEQDIKEKIKLAKKLIVVKNISEKIDNYLQILKWKEISGYLTAEEYRQRMNL